MLSNTYHIEGGSSGSYLPVGKHVVVPSYFEEQHSTESINDAMLIANQISEAADRQNLLPNQA